MATSSFGASLVGNGFTNDGSAAGLAAGGGSGGNPSFDLNDFPSLGGGGVVGAVSTGSAGTDNGLAAALRQQQQLLQQQMMQQGVSVGVGGVSINSASASDKSSNLYRLAMSSGIANGVGPSASNNFSMTTEDFPALGASGGDAGSGGVGAPGQGQPEGAGSTTLGVGGVGVPSAAPGSGGILDASSGGNQLDYTGLIGSAGGAGTSIGVQPGSSSSRMTSGATQSGSGSLSTAGTGGSSANASSGSSGGAIGGDFGLLGLLSVPLTLLPLMLAPCLQSRLLTC